MLWVLIGNFLSTRFQWAEQYMYCGEKYKISNFFGEKR